MAYKIIVQGPAKEDAREHAAFILNQGGYTETSRRWLEELERLIQGLADMPKRFKVIEEQASFDIALHQVLHYSHRVIYHVDERELIVHVLRVYHGSRRPLSPEEVAVP